VLCFLFSFLLFCLFLNKQLKKVDRMVSSVAPTLATWLNHDPDALQKLRNDLGLHLEGTLACVPILTSPICRPGTMVRKSYFINFQANPDPYPAGTLEPQFAGADGVSVSWTSIRFGSGAWQPMARFGNMPGEDPVKVSNTDTCFVFPSVSR